MIVCIRLLFIEFFFPSLQKHLQNDDSLRKTFSTFFVLFAFILYFSRCRLLFLLFLFHCSFSGRFHSILENFCQKSFQEFTTIHTNCSALWECDANEGREIHCALNCSNCFSWHFSVQICIFFVYNYLCVVLIEFVLW